MYLDNILLTKNVCSSVSYSEILMDCMSTSESVQEAEAWALTSEFSRHTLGSEAASDWWPKIKAFFKKIWEALKRMFAKVVAWIASLPNKIVTLCKKIYEAWVKRGLEGKMKNLRKNIEKKIVGLNPELAKDFNDTDWGFQDPLLIKDSFKKFVEEAPKKDQKNNFAALVMKGALTREVIREVVQGAAKTYAETVNAAEEGGNLSDLKDRVRDICEDIRTGIEDAVDAEYKDKVISFANLEEWYSTVKNDHFAKEFKTVSRSITVSIEVMDRLHEQAYKEFETMYKNDDEDGAKMLTLELKGINVITQAAIYAENFLARIFATAALNRAKMVVAGIKCFDAQGAKNSGGAAKANGSSAGGSGTKTAEIVKDPAKQKNTPPTPKNTPKPKPASGNGKTPEEAQQAYEDMKKRMGWHSEYVDPDFAAFLRL